MDEIFNNISKETKMVDLWNEILKNKWAEGYKLAEFKIDSITIEDVFWWSLLNNIELKDDIKKILSDNNVLIDIDSRKNKKFIKTKINPEISEIIDKIYSISVDRGLNIMDIIAEAKSSTNLISTIQKNATKQISYESFASQFINKKINKQICYTLQNEHFAIRFAVNGEPEVGGGALDSSTKSVDLAIILVLDTSIKVFLASHKFARESGGHQDNQLRDAVYYIDRALVAKEKNLKINGLKKFVQDKTNIFNLPIEYLPILILDGDYFNSKISKTRSDFPRCAFIGSTDEFLDFYTSLTDK